MAGMQNLSQEDLVGAGEEEDKKKEEENKVREGEEKGVSREGRQVIMGLAVAL